MGLSIYLFDTGITNAMNRRLSAALDPIAFGRLFEHWIVLECRRILDYHEPEARLFYWRTNVGTEVDLLIEKHGELRLAVEIKRKKKVVGADCTGLRSFSDAHPGVPCVVASLAPEEYAIKHIQVLPYDRLLKRLRRYL